MHHAYNPSTLGAWDGWIIWGQEFETSLGNMVKPRLYKKYLYLPPSPKKWAGCMSVVPVAWKAEVGESIESWGVEVALSPDHATALQPGWQSKTLFQTNKHTNKQTNKQSTNLGAPIVH